MRTAPAGFKTTLAADQNPYVWLVTIAGEEETFRYALWAEAIVFDGETYEANAGKMATQEQTTAPRTPRLTLRLQNIDRILGAWLLEGDRRGTAVTLTAVMRDNLEDADAKIEETYDIAEYGVDHDDADISLGARDAIRGVPVPRRRTQSAFCPWVYKGAECGYVGELATCDFTYDGPNGCTKHFGRDKPKRFGGFLGLLRQGIARL